MSGWNNRVAIGPVRLDALVRRMRHWYGSPWQSTLIGMMLDGLILNLPGLRRIRAESRFASDESRTSAATVLRGNRKSPFARHSLSCNQLISSSSTPSKRTTRHSSDAGRSRRPSSSLDKYRTGRHPFLYAYFFDTTTPYGSYRGLSSSVFSQFRRCLRAGNGTSIKHAAGFGPGVPPKLIIFNGFLVGAGAQHCQGQIRQRDRFATTMTIPTRNGDFGVTRAGSEWPARRAHSTACPNA